MPNQPDSEVSPQLESPSASPKPSLSPSDIERNRSIHSVIGLCSLALIGCFFLPWVRVLFAELSGYQIQQLSGDEVNYVWAIPITALLALFASVVKQGAQFFGQIAGLMPFVALAYYRFKLGEDFFDRLRIGAFLTLGIAAILFCVPHFLKKPPKG